MNRPMFRLVALAVLLALSVPSMATEPFQPLPDLEALPDLDNAPPRKLHADQPSWGQPVDANGNVGGANTGKSDGNFNGTASSTDNGRYASNNTGGNTNGSASSNNNGGYASNNTGGNNNGSASSNDNGGYASNNTGGNTNGSASSNDNGGYASNNTGGGNTNGSASSNDNGGYASNNTGGGNTNGSGNNSANSGGMNSAGKGGLNSGLNSSHGSGLNSDAYPPLTKVDAAMQPNYAPPGMPQMPSKCAEDKSCRPCFEDANANLDIRRRNLEKVRGIYTYTHRFAQEGKDLMNGVGGLAGGAPAVEAAVQSRSVDQSLDAFDDTVRAKNAELLGKLKDDLHELAACEAKYYGNNEWYPRYGELYYQFMQARYSL